jgi:hypothetical protein
MPFANTWTYIQHNLGTGTKVRYWSFKKGWTPRGEFEITSVSQNDITITTASGTPCKIIRSEFDGIYQTWSAAWNQNLQRQSIVRGNRKSSYIISIYFRLHGERGSALL